MRNHKNAEFFDFSQIFNIQGTLDNMKFKIEQFVFNFKKRNTFEISLRKNPNNNQIDIEKRH